MISQKSIQEVYAVASIEDVVQDYVSLRRRGVNMLGLCPFHDEKTPSFTVSPAKNIYKCFGCGKGGDTVKFLMEQEQLTYPEAIRRLALRYNIHLDETVEDNEQYLEEKQLKESLQIVNDYAQSYFEENLWENDIGRSVGLAYFKERGFREATIKKFGLGFALNTQDHFTQTAITKRYNIEALRQLGLTSSKDLDFFRDRVMFTIHGLSGKPIAFAGRTLSSNKKVPKYINSPESPLYNKSNVLYGLHLAKQSISQANNCFMVEGYTDVISLHQGGIENVVASSGTSLTDGQIKALKRYTDTITLLYDGDAAGIKAASRGLDLIVAQGMNVFLLTLPPSHDPDSYLREVGRQVFETYIDDKRIDFIEYKARSVANDFKNDPIGKAKGATEIIKTLTLIDQSVKRTFYIQLCAEILGMDENIIQAEVAKVIRAKIKQDRTKSGYTDQQQLNPREGEWIATKPQPKGSQASFVKSDLYQERDLARICISDGDKLMTVEGEQVTVAAFVYASIFDVIEYFDDVTSKDIIIETFRLVESDEFSHNYFIQHQTPEIQALAIDILTTRYEYASWASRGVALQTQLMPELNFDKDSFQSILRFKYKKIQRIIKELSKKILIYTESQDDDQLRLALLALQKIQEERKSLADRLGTIVG